ncbi:MAG: biopolymer transporter ExbD [Planctomycetota bacterium]
MSHKKMGASADHGDDSGHGGDRPWVYFMIDSFFLVTQFFVLTFKVRTGEDLILPHKLPPGGAGKPTPDVLVKETLPVAITVNRDTAESAPWYKINGGSPGDLQSLNSTLGSLVEGKDPSKFSVRISYEGKVIFKDVMPIFNTCIKYKISECGLQPSRERITSPR